MKILGLLGQKTDEGLSGLGRLWDELTGGVKPEQVPQVEAMRTQGYSPEYTGGLLKFGEEGMTQEARMARAAEQGFEGPFYRWTEGGQGRVVRTPEVDAGLKFGPAGYASPQPDYGARYVDPTKSNVQPLMARGPLADLNEVDRVSQGLIAQRKEAGLPQWPGHQQHWAEMQDALKAEGYRGVRYGDKEVASFEPEKNMRSINAVFDPEGKGGLLGGVGGATVLGGGLLGGSEEAEAGVGSKILGQISETGFFSPLERAVGGLSQQKGTGDQMLAMIQKQAGVKPEEVQWTGLGDFLAGKPSVTKSEIEDYLLNNRVELKEVKLQAPAINLESPYATPEVRRILEQHQGEAPNAIQIALMNDYDAYRSLERVNPNLVNLDDWEDVVLNDVLNVQMPYQTADEWQRAINTAEGAGDWNTAEQLTRAWEANEGFGPAGMPKFGQYTTPGGSNYRELLMTMPSKAQEGMLKPERVPDTNRWRVGNTEYYSEQDAQRAANYMNRTNKELAGDYVSSHYKEHPNILAHTRVKDYEQDGQKILHVDEVQSDWHQAGRKQGYASADKAKTDAAIKEYESLMQQMSNIGLSNMSAQSRARIEELRPIVSGQGRASNQVPDAPFKKNWHELMTRRILQEAADKGYSRVTFTTGQTQADRYDLSQRIQSIRYFKGKDGYRIDALPKDAGWRSLGSKVPEDKLEDYVGKEIADKIIKAEGDKDRAGFSFLYNTDLKIGGEGMKGFYDNMMVKAFNKEGKKFNVKVEPYNLKTGKGGEQVWSMEIPPEMRAKRKAEGSPLFSAAPFGGLLGGSSVEPSPLEAEVANMMGSIGVDYREDPNFNYSMFLPWRKPKSVMYGDGGPAMPSLFRDILRGALTAEKAGKYGNDEAAIKGLLDSML